VRMALIKRQLTSLWCTVLMHTSEIFNDISQFHFHKTGQNLLQLMHIQ
jgi:hypothetical protein